LSIDALNNTVRVNIKFSIGKAIWSPHDRLMPWTLGSFFLLATQSELKPEHQTQFHRYVLESLVLSDTEAAHMYPYVHTRFDGLS